MNTILFALVPVIVTAMITVIKRIPAVNDATNQGFRNLIIRSIAAILSIGGVVGVFMLTGNVPDPSILTDDITVIALAFMTFLGSVGGHEIAKTK